MPHDCPLCGATAAIPLTILLDRGMVVVGDRFVVIPASEVMLLQRLAEVFPRLLSRAAAMEWLYQLRPDAEPEIKIVDVFICKLRKKLAPLGIKIDTYWGRGYALAVAARPRIVREAA